MSGSKKKLSLAAWIFIALVLGCILGGILIAVPGGAAFSGRYIKPIGTIFINLLKFIVVPIVLFSMVCGMISMKDIKKVGSIGWKTMVYYICTTVIALVIGLVLANIFKGGFPQLSTEGLGTWDKATSADFMTTLVDIFPSNIVAPFANASMLQIIVIALLIGAGIILTGEKGRATAELFESLNEVFMTVMMFIIKLSPIGAVCTYIAGEDAPNGIGGDIVMKDGTSVYLSGNTIGSSGENHSNGMFSVPIALENVDYIKFPDGTKLPMPELPAE